MTLERLLDRVPSPVAYAVVAAIVAVGAVAMPVADWWDRHTTPQRHL